MISTQYIKLNMIPSGVMPVLYCSQYDVGRPLGMVVYNGGEAVDLDGYTCTIEATRTDGTAITAAVTTDDNIGAFVTTATMTNEVDKYQAKLVLFDSNSRRVASLAFIMCITAATMDENAESIEEDASLYQQFTGAVQALIAEIREDILALDADLQDETDRAERVNYEYPHTGSIFTNVHHTFRFNTSYKTNANQYRSGQACVYIPGTNTYILCIRGRFDESCYLREVNWSTGVLVREVYANLSHCNWLSYDPSNGHVYATGFQTNADATPLGTLFILDYETLTVIDTIDFTSKIATALGAVTRVKLASFGLDYITGKYYLSSYTYDTAYRTDLFEYDWNTDTITQIELVESLTELYRAGTQGFCVHNGIAYFLKAEDFSIYAYDLQNQYTIGVISLPLHDGYGLLLGEYEQLSVMSYTNKAPFFVISSVSASAYSSYDLYYISRISPFKRANEKMAGIYWERFNDIYVDYTQNSAVQYGTYNEPYSTIEQAMQRLMNYKSGGRIYIKSSVNADVTGTWDLQPYSGCNVFIRYDNLSSALVKVNGIAVRNQDIEIHNIYIDRINSNTEFTHGIMVYSGASLHILNTMAPEEITVPDTSIYVDNANLFLSDYNKRVYEVEVLNNSFIQINVNSNKFISFVANRFFTGKIASAAGTLPNSGFYDLGKIQLAEASNALFKLSLWLGSNSVGAAVFECQCSAINMTGVDLLYSNGTDVFTLSLKRDSDYHFYAKATKNGSVYTSGFRAWIESL